MYFTESQNMEGQFGFKRNEALTFKLILGPATVARQSCAGQIQWQCLSLDVLSSFQCSSTKSLQSCLTLCNPMDCSPPGSSVNGILQARLLEWVTLSYSGDLPGPGVEPATLASPALAGRFLTTSATVAPTQS